MKDIRKSRIEKEDVEGKTRRPSRQDQQERLQAEVLEIIGRSEIPLDADYVSRRLGIGWGTGRYLLLSLAYEGRIVATKTSKSWIFSPRPKPI